MKEEIENLRKLAERYAEYFTGKANDGHNVLKEGRGFPETGCISVYFADRYKTWGVDINGIYIQNYALAVSIPFKLCSVDDLVKSHEMGVKFLDKFIEEKEEEFIEKANKKKDRRIKELLKELEVLNN